MKCILCDKEIKEVQDWKLGVQRLTHMMCFDKIINVLSKDTENEILTLREKKVLKDRFGFTDGLEINTTKTLEEVGQNFGVTRERIRQISTKALNKIRRFYERTKNSKTE